MLPCTWLDDKVEWHKGELPCFGREDIKVLLYKRNSNEVDWTQVAKNQFCQMELGSGLFYYVGEDPW